MNKTTRIAITFVLGCIAYPYLELCFRGYTHWTMSLTGGLCFALLYTTEEAMPDLPFWQKALAGALMITAAELVVGSIVNLWLHWNVWSYENLRLHFLGQISLVFTAIWYFLCCLFFGISAGIRRSVFQRAPDISGES